MKKPLFIAFLFISLVACGQSDTINHSREKFIVPFAGGSGIYNATVDNPNSNYGHGGMLDIGVGIWNEKLSEQNAEPGTPTTHYGPRYECEVAINWPEGHYFIGPKFSYEIMRGFFFGRLSAIEYTNFKQQTPVLCPEIGIWYFFCGSFGWNIPVAKDNLSVGGWRISIILEIPIKRKSATGQLD